MCKLAVSRLVVKFGTESLSSGVEGKKVLNQKIFNDFARQISLLHCNGVEVVIVSSGAIRAGREAAEDIGLKTKLLEKKQIAGIGARHLMTRWGKAFKRYKKEVAQVWVTYANLSHPGDKRSIKESILSYLECGVVPVINENDVVSDEEIRSMEQGISENDKLAQKIAFLIEADAVLFITALGGIYENDPKIYPEAKFYPEIDCVSNFALNSSSISEGGTGGVETKLKAAFECAKSGKRVAIAGREEDAISKFVQGLPVGTSIKCSTKEE
ncbi:MAG: hypothetical protein Q8N55_01615 [bacterium]|nr:hypothetical protein [bacterium]